GQVDTAYFLPVSSYDTLTSIPGYKVVPSTIRSSFEAWYLNVGGFQAAGKPASDEPLTDPAVRKALAISFDTKQEISVLWHNLAVPTCDEAMGTFGHDPELINANGYCTYGPNGTSFSLDNGGPDAAKALLDAAGWVPGSDGIRVKNGHRLTLRISTSPGRAYREISEALARAAWQAIGVELKIKNYTPCDGCIGVPILLPPEGLDPTYYDILEFGVGVGVDPDN